MNNLKIDTSSSLIGKIRIGNGGYIAQGSVVRSIEDSVTIGNDTWILENSTIIGTPTHPFKVGSKTVFGHKCVAIGAEIGNLCEIGNGVIFLPGSKIGNMCIFGEGTIIPENTTIPDNSVVLGRPYRIIRKVTEDDLAMIKRMRQNDIDLSEYRENIIEQYSREDDKMNNLYEFNGKLPVISDSTYIYDSAEITGDVIIGENSVVASGVRIIGNSHGPIKIGNNVQILENSVLHLLPDNELIIKDNVTIGPGCIIHGTYIDENSVVESGAIISDYSFLGKNTLVKSGSLIKQRDKFEDNAVVEGFPAKEIGKNSTIQKRPDWAIR